MDKKILDTLERLVAVGMILGGFMVKEMTITCIGIAFFIYKL